MTYPAANLLFGDKVKCGDTMPGISVIIPIYNAGMYLEACIDSVLHQQYQNFELILVNDGSTDCSAGICKAYAARDQRIRYLEQENSGVSAARNAGKAVACGKYLLFADADDILHFQMLDILYRQAVQTEADISICAVHKTAEEPIEQNRIERFDSRIIDKKNALEHLFLGKQVECGVWNKLFRREFVQEFSFTVGKRINEDKYFVFQTILCAEKIAFTSAKLYYYVQHDGSVTRQSFSDRCFDARFFADRIYSETVAAFPDMEPLARFNLLRAEYTVLRQMYPYRSEYPDEYRSVCRTIKNIRLSGITGYLSAKQLYGICCVKWFPVGYRVFRKLAELSNSSGH